MTIDENHILCSTFFKFFAAKIEDLKHSIQAKISSLTSSSQYLDCSFTGNPISNFLPVTPDEVSKLLLSSSTKSSRQDFIPTSLINSCSSVFSELISTLANLSFSQCTFPSRFKLALVSPLIKKHGLDKKEHFQDLRATAASMSSWSYNLINQFQPFSVGISQIQLHRNCLASYPLQYFSLNWPAHVHGTCIPRPKRSVWHYRSFHPPK